MTNITYQILHTPMPEYRSLERMMQDYLPQSIYRRNTATLDKRISKVYLSLKQIQRLFQGKSVKLGRLVIMLGDVE